MNKATLNAWVVSGFLLAAGTSMGDMGGKAGMGGGMSMMDMMGKSKMNCMSTSDTLADLQKTVQDAVKSDDKSKMKAALQLVENRISGMQAHMGQCSNMMETMGTMMGGGMMGGGSMGKDKPKEPSAQPGGSKKMDKEDHEKHH